MVPEPGPAQGAPLPAGLAPDMNMFQDDDGGPPLIGSITGNNYVAPSGSYRVRIPIHVELGGQINDTENNVTFQDAFGDNSSIGAFPLNADFRIEMAKREHKDFLIWFFQNVIQADFQRNIPGTTAEPNARYNASTQGGALVTQLLIPDGSMYMERVFIFPPKNPVVARRGNLVFMRDNIIYVLSTELAERVFEHSTWKKTVAEEEEILRQRLYDLLSNMVFMKPNTNAYAPGYAPVPAPAPANPPAAAPAASDAPVIRYPAHAPATTGTAGARAPAK
jgi:hypothetical protein